MPEGVMPTSSPWRRVVAYCIECGLEMPDRAKFCPECGTTGWRGPAANGPPQPVVKPIGPMVKPFGPEELERQRRNAERDAAWGARLKAERKMQREEAWPPQMDDRDRKLEAEGVEWLGLEGLLPLRRLAEERATDSE